MSTPVELQEIEVRAQAIAERIPLIKIVNAESFALAVEDRAEIKRRRARIAELMNPICDAAYKTWKTAVAKRESLDAPFAEADKAYSRAQGAYDQEQARLRREAEEATRRERERLEAVERARVAAEEARLRKEEDDRRLAEAAEAEAAGDTEAAERILAAPVETPVVAPRPIFVPPPAVQAPKAAGVSFRDNWDFEIVDAALIPREYLVPDETKLRGVVRALKHQTRIPGVRAVNERIAVQRNTP